MPYEKCQVCSPETHINNAALAVMGRTNWHITDTIHTQEPAHVFSKRELRILRNTWKIMASSDILDAWFVLWAYLEHPRLHHLAWRAKTARRRAKNLARLKREFLKKERIHEIK